MVVEKEVGRTRRKRLQGQKEKEAEEVGGEEEEGRAQRGRTWRFCSEPERRNGSIHAIPSIEGSRKYKADKPTWLRNLCPSWYRADCLSLGLGPSCCKYFVRTHQQTPMAAAPGNPIRYLGTFKVGC